MSDILNLALPYFGLIFVGYACGKFKRLPEAGLSWMNFFLLYVSLPALFFRIMSKTPFEQLNNFPFILATTSATASAFMVSAFVNRILGGRSASEAAMAGVAGAYGNIGYMGPGLALAAIGTKAAVPVALIFCFDNIFLFSITPLVMTLFSPERRPIGSTIKIVVKQIAMNPLILACFWGAMAAAAHLEVPVAIDRMLQFLQNAAAPVALFSLGVTVALRPFEQMPWDVPGVVVVKLLIHPVIVLWMLFALGPFPVEWSATAVLLASLPPALNVFLLARQYDTWIEASSAAVLVGTFVSVITLTAVLWMLKTNQIPFY